VHCFVRSYGWFENEDSIFIAMEYAKHSDLQKHLTRPFPELEARGVTTQIVEGLAFMHSNGFAHRDLKPANILVFSPGPSWWVKIGDFGISKRLEGSTVRTAQIGTRGFIAPEVLGLFCPNEFRGTANFSYTMGVDVWAVGEIVFRMISTRPTFPELGELVQYVIQGGQFPVGPLETAGSSAICCDFVQKMMTASPKNRMLTESALKHPWIVREEQHERSDSSSTHRFVAISFQRLRYTESIFKF
jgi:serine/threonine protein kinase